MDTPADGDEPQALYPGLGAVVNVSDNTAKMKANEDALVKVFHGVKTLEYDLALHEANRSAMLKALKELHPQIGKTVEASVNAASGDAEKAARLCARMLDDSAAGITAEERTRIARELHDIVSHSISVVTIQTQAVRRRLGPEHAQEAADLAAVEATAREALAEMRRLFGVLRTSDEYGGVAVFRPGLVLGETHGSGGGWSQPVALTPLSGRGRSASAPPTTSARSASHDRGERRSSSPTCR